MMTEEVARKRNIRAAQWSVIVGILIKGKQTWTFFFLFGSSNYLALGRNSNYSKKIFFALHCPEKSRLCKALSGKLNFTSCGRYGFRMTS